MCGIADGEYASSAPLMEVESPGSLPSILIDLQLPENTLSAPTLLKSSVKQFTWDCIH